MMQTDSIQTDTLKSDSSIPVLQVDTPLPDSAGALIKQNAEGKIQIQDSTPRVEEKKAGIKIIADTGSKEPVFAEDDFRPISPTGNSADSLPDSGYAVMPAPADTLKHTLSDTGKIISENVWNPGKIRPSENHSWIVLLFIAVFSILAWIKVSYSKRLRQFFEAFLSNRYIRQLVREEFVFSHPSSIALSVVFLINISLLLTLANQHFGWQIFGGEATSGMENPLPVFFKFLFSLFAFYLGKTLAVRLCGLLFNAGEELTEYLFNLFLFNQILGLLLLPLTLLAVFANAMPARNILFFSGGLVLLSFVFRLVKCIYIGALTTKFSKSYIILYICTLEILPLMVIIKAFSGSV